MRARRWWGSRYVALSNFLRLFLSLLDFWHRSQIMDGSPSRGTFSPYPCCIFRVISPCYSLHRNLVLLPSLDGWRSPIFAVETCLQSYLHPQAVYMGCALDIWQKPITKQAKQFPSGSSWEDSTSPPLSAMWTRSIQHDIIWVWFWLMKVSGRKYLTSLILPSVSVCCPIFAIIRSYTHFPCSALRLPPIYPCALHCFVEAFSLLAERAPTDIPLSIQTLHASSGRGLSGRIIQFTVKPRIVAVCRNFCGDQGGHKQTNKPPSSSLSVSFFNSRLHALFLTIRILLARTVTLQVHPTPYLIPRPFHIRSSTTPTLKPVSVTSFHPITSRLSRLSHPSTLASPFYDSSWFMNLSHVSDWAGTLVPSLSQISLPIRFCLAESSYPFSTFSFQFQDAHKPNRCPSLLQTIRNRPLPSSAWDRSNSANSTAADSSTATIGGPKQPATPGWSSSAASSTYRSSCACLAFPVLIFLPFRWLFVHNTYLNWNA